MTSVSTYFVRNTRKRLKYWHISAPLPKGVNFILFITEYKALHTQIETTEVTINRILQNLYCKLSFLICFLSLDGCTTVTRVDCLSVAGTSQLAQTYDSLRDQKDSKGVVPSYADVKTV
jgi:hypothetical protein